jgi:hypothetical protein
MSKSVRIFEGVAVRGIDGEAPVLRLPVAPAPSDRPDPAPHPVYSLDGLLALALAVRELEVSG